MDAGKRTINDIFNGNRILEIPFFQRAYVWGNDQWERLLEDMENVSFCNSKTTTDKHRKSSWRHQNFN